MQPDSFKGTNELYSFWNDMNEPSVFSENELAMPKENLHWKADGQTVRHRDLHNMYGALQ
jgi:alpha-glucosidase (family GH31 glycosyl hydrolase)